MIRAKHVGAPIALALLNATSSVALAAPAAWHSDAMGTSMELSFNHSKLIEVPLILGTVTGTAAIDDSDLTKSTLQIAADLTGLISYNERWPKQLRSDSFFDASANPTITFTSRRIVRSGLGYKASGDFTMHGVTRPETFALSWSKSLTYKDIKFRGITLTGEVNWHDFGMTYKDSEELQDYPEFGNSFKLQINLELSNDTPPQP